MSPLSRTVFAGRYFSDGTTPRIRRFGRFGTDGAIWDIRNNPHIRDEFVAASLKPQFLKNGASCGLYRTERKGEIRGEIREQLTNCSNSGFLALRYPSPAWPRSVFETWILLWTSQDTNEPNSSHNKRMQFRRRLCERCWAHVCMGASPKSSQRITVSPRADRLM